MEQDDPHDQAPVFRAAPRKPKRRRCRKEIERAIERERQDSQLYNLTLDVNALRQEIQDLKRQKQLIGYARAYARTPLITRGDPNGSIMQIVRQYFSELRHGVPPDEAGRRQAAFMQTFCDPEFTLGTSSFGCDTMIEHWRQYTRGISRFCYDLYSVEIVLKDESGSVVTCYGGFGGYMTRQLIETVFPHALSDESMVARMLGKPVWFLTSKRFYLSQEGRLLRCDAVIDMVTALQQLFQGAPDELAWLMRHALVGEECMIAQEAQQAEQPTSSQRDENNRQQTNYTPSRQIKELEALVEPQTVTPTNDNRYSIRYILS